MNTLVVYYSRTGNTQQVARTIVSNLESPTVERIRPVTQRTYLNWLVRSCVPGLRVPIHSPATDLKQYDAVFLGTPKWTLSCPPVTEFVERTDVTDVTMGIFMTYGGFDAERYLKDLVEQLDERGAQVAASFRVKRDRIDTPECTHRSAKFCRAVMADE